MNIYGVIALILTIIIFAHVFDAVEPIREFLFRITDIPVFEEYSDRPALFKLLIRLSYLIAVVAIFKIIFMRKTDE